MMKYSGIVVLSTAAIALHGCGDKDEDVKATEKIYKSDLEAMKEATKKAQTVWKAAGTTADEKAKAKTDALKICDDAKKATEKKVEEAKKDDKKSSFVQAKEEKKDADKKKTPEYDAWKLEYEQCKKFDGEEVQAP